MNFTLFAPAPARVDLLLRDRRHPMQRLDRGMWIASVDDAGPGDLYAFSLDGGPPRPDPRSRDQPEGVHGPSRIVEPRPASARAPGRAPFRSPPLSSAIIYELHVGTFTAAGTLDAAIECLDHLVDLGITHVELMPINAFDGRRGWGYDGVLWFAPHRAYTGDDGPHAVERFVDACHTRGLAVVLDVVYNHLGPSGNYHPEFGGIQNPACGTPWGPAINLEGPHSDGVRRLIIDSALMWLGEYGFDGLRIDAIHALHDRSAVHLLEQLRSEVDLLAARTGRRFDLIAESDLNDPRVVTPIEAGGLGMDAQWSDDFHHALHAVLTSETTGYYADFGSVDALAKAWADAFCHDGDHAPSRQRRHGRPARGQPSSRFLAYSQNHDQVGNRATGERLAHIAGPHAARLAAAIVVLSPFVPMLFQGEEFAASSPFQYFTDFDDPDLAEAVRQGRRREFAAAVGAAREVPDPQAHATFERSTLDWSELGRPQHAETLAWYRRLITLRRTHPDLAPETVGTGDVACSDDPPWLVCQRRGLTLCFNLGRSRRTLPARRVRPSHRVLLTSDAELVVGDGVVNLAPLAAAVLEPAADAAGSRTH